MSYFRQTENGVELFIRATPRAKQAKFLGVQNGRLRVSITAPPEDGKANRALIAYLSKQFKIPKSRISVIAGDLSREKTILLLDIEPTLVLKTVDESLP